MTSAHTSGVEDVATSHVVKFTATTTCSCGAQFSADAFDLSVAQSNARYQLRKHQERWNEIDGGSAGESDASERNS